MVVLIAGVVTLEVIRTLRLIDALVRDCLAVGVWQQGIAAGRHLTDGPPRVVLVSTLFWLLAWLTAANRWRSLL